MAIAALHYATLMALPLMLIGLGSGFAALPVVLGFPLEALRAVVRRGLKSQIRISFLREAAVRALDKRVLVPEADVESAFWAAHLTERMIAVDTPALLAASLAGASVLTLAAPAITGSAMWSLLTLVLATAGLTIWNNKRRATDVDAAVEHRQRTAGWVAAAERDGGEIYGQRARAPFLARVIDSAQMWSIAEERLERKGLQSRMLLAALFLFGVVSLLRSQHINPLYLSPDHNFSAYGISGLLLLSSGIPIVYVFAVHFESLLATYASLTQLLPEPANLPAQLRALERRPARLTARALSFSYLPSAPRPALAAVDFEVDLERITLIIAPNGAGKTTLARLICGVLTPDTGTLQIDGIPCSEVSRDDFGFVPQNPLIVETLSIEENVRLVAPDATAEAIEGLMLELGLQRPIHHLAGQLSRGQQRRIAIVRAILKEPRLLVLDEPDVWLDADGRTRLARVLVRQSVMRAVLVVSHRREWLPNDASVIDWETHPAEADSARASVGTNSACG